MAPKVSQSFPLKSDRLILAVFERGYYQPTLNPKSGLPHTFENIPLSLHVELRKRSILELKAVSLYATLVTSLYFARAMGKQRHIESHEDSKRIAKIIQE